MDKTVYVFISSLAGLAVLSGLWVLYFAHTSSAQAPVCIYPGGTGAAGQAAFWVDSGTIGGDSSLRWDNATKRLDAYKLNATNSICLAGVCQSTWSIGGGGGWANTSGTVYLVNSSALVGIGTTFPVKNLDVVGVINATSQVCIAGDCRAAWPTMSSSGWMLSGNYLYNNTAGVLVGIGTSNPMNLLHLYQSGSTTLLNTSNGTVNAGLYIGTLSGGQAGASMGTNSNNQFRIFSNNTDRMTVDTNGNVGIGTTAPDKRLDVRDSVRLGSYNGATDIYIGSSGYAGSVQGVRFGGWGVADTLAAFNTVLYVSSNAGGTGAGNVGIGTTGPGSQLEVGTNVAFTGRRLRLLGYATTAGTDAILEIGDGGTVYWRMARNNANNFQTDMSGTWGIIGGNIGIGTASPNNKLEVTGGNIALGTAGSIVDFGYGVAGREVNAGKIGYGTFTAGTLNIVGGGTTAPRIVDVWESLRLNGGSVIFSDGTTQATASIGRKAFPVPTSNSFTSEDYIDDQNTSTAMTSGQITNTYREVVYNLGGQKHFILNLDASLYGDATDSQPRLYLYYSNDGSTWYKNKVYLTQSGNTGEIRESLSMAAYAQYIKIRSEHYSGSSHASTVRVYEASLFY